MDRAFSEHWGLLHEAVQESIERNALLYSDHALKQMKERGISDRETKDVLINHPPHEMFAPYEYPYGDKPFSNPDPVFSVIGKADLVVAVAVQRYRRRIRFVVITVFHASEHSRHKK